MEITFLGAVGTVTGSKYLVQHENKRILVDCGLFQGYKQLRLRNWQPLPVDIHKIDAVLLTHAHLDHSGYLPLLVRNGFKGPVYSTKSTRDLCDILLPDSGHLLEQEAGYINRHRFSKHHPALPLYTEENAVESLRFLKTVEFYQEFEIGGMKLRFLRAGHILGAAMIEVKANGTTLLFSGDVGRPDDISMPPPDAIPDIDYLVVESTYGNKMREKTDVESSLAEAITRVASRGGSIIVPAFAVGRTQNLLLHLANLKATRRIPELPIFVDSPMAIDASDIYLAHSQDHRLSAAEIRKAFGVARYVRDAKESESLDAMVIPKVIVSASGMATGGRVLHHLKSYVSDPRNMILFTGFQAGGTRGAAMVAGADTVKIFGAHIPIRAEIRNLEQLSAHADAGELLSWMGTAPRPPKMTYITHGEPDAADSLRKRIGEELRWDSIVPEYRDVYPL